MARGKFKALRQPGDEEYDEDSEYSEGEEEYEVDDEADVQEYDEDEYEDEDAEYEDEDADGDDSEYEDATGEYEDDADGDDDGEYEDDADDEYDNTPPSVLEALKRSFSRGQPASGSASDELRVKFLTSKETIYGYVLAAIMGVVAGLIFSRARSVIYKPGKGKTAAATLKLVTSAKALTLQAHGDAKWDLLVFGGMAVLMILGSLSKRRSLLGFALCLGGLALGIPFGIPWLGVGIWLIFKVMRRSRATGAGPAGSRRPPVASRRSSAPTRGGSRSLAAATTSPAGRTTTASDAGSQRQIGRNRRVTATDTPTSAPAPASKRYTPPTPVRRSVAPLPEPQPTNKLSAWLRK